MPLFQAALYAVFRVCQPYQSRVSVCGVSRYPVTESSHTPGGCQPLFAFGGVGGGLVGRGAGGALCVAAYWGRPARMSTPICIPGRNPIPNACACARRRIACVARVCALIPAGGGLPAGRHPPPGRHAKNPAPVSLRAGYVCGVHSRARCRRALAWMSQRQRSVRASDKPNSPVAAPVCVSIRRVP